MERLHLVLGQKLSASKVLDILSMKSLQCYLCIKRGHITKELNLKSDVFMT